MVNSIYAYIIWQYNDIRLNRSLAGNIVTADFTYWGYALDSGAPHM